jgi:hypothetical protein
MRWHVELNDTGTQLHVDHSDDEERARRMMIDLAGSAHGGHKGLTEEHVTRAVGRFAEEDLADIEPGTERVYEIAEGFAILVAALEDVSTPADCWKCNAEASRQTA